MEGGMITIPYGRWHEFIPNIRSGPTLAHMIIFQQWRIWGAGLFLVCYSRKILFMQEFFTLLSFLECEYPKKRGGAGYRNGRWAGGITAALVNIPWAWKIPITPLSQEAHGLIPRGVIILCQMSILPHLPTKSHLWVFVWSLLCCVWA